MVIALAAHEGHVSAGVDGCGCGRPNGVSLLAD